MTTHVSGALSGPVSPPVPGAAPAAAVEDGPVVSRSTGTPRPAVPDVGDLVAQGLHLLRRTAGHGLGLVGPGRLPVPGWAGRGLPLGRFVGAGPASTRPAVSLRRGGVDLDPADVALGYPRATTRLLVLVAPPGQWEDTWARGDHATTYAAQLAALLDWTPVHIVTRDGPTAEVGTALSGLLQRVVGQWPVPVERIALVGLGDAGLGLRAACAVRPVGAEPAWPDLVTDLVALGTPHLVVRAPRGATSVGLDLDARLAGITTDDVADPGLAPPPHVRHVVVGTATPSGGLGRLLGGLLWWRHTGRARRARALFPTATRYTVDTSTAPLAQHPEVASALLDWLA